MMRLHWVPVTVALPDFGRTCLVRGESYDSGYQDGYEIAYRAGSETDWDWVVGKQQSEIGNVTHWAEIPLWDEAYVY